MNVDSSGGAVTSEHRTSDDTTSAPTTVSQPAPTTDSQPVSQPAPTTDSQPVSPAVSPPQEAPAAQASAPEKNVGPAPAPAAHPAAPDAVVHADTVSVGSTDATAVAPPPAAVVVSAPAASLDATAGTVAPEPESAALQQESTVVSVLAAAVAPFVLPGPATPAASPLLWAVLAWTRREAEVDGSGTALRSSAAAVPTLADFEVEEDQPLFGNVLDLHPDVTPGTVTVGDGTAPAHGTLTLDGSGNFVYTPDQDFSGDDQFGYTLTDFDGVVVTATARITVTPAPDAPVGSDTSVSTDEDTPITSTLPAAVDVDGDALVYAVAQPPQSGTVVVAADGAYTYTPAPNFNGVDSFGYTVSDGTFTVGYVVTVTVAPVDDAPVALDDTATGPEDSKFTGVVPVTEVDGDVLTYGIDRGPQHGTVTLGADGRYLYTPNADFHGTDTFTYTVTDGTTAPSTGTIAITVTPVNDPPRSEHLDVSTAEDTPYDGVLPTSDADGDPLTYDLFGTPAHGTVVIRPDGSFTYRPDADYNGADEFTYHVMDGTTYGQYVVRITVTAVNDVPVTTPAAFTTGPGVAVTDTVAWHASDVDVADELTFTAAAPTAGTVTMDADGQFTYTPRPGFSGTDTFVFTVTDTAGATATGVVSVTVANQQPVAYDDGYQVTPGATLTVDAAHGLLANDVDPGDPLTVTSVTQPAHGTVTVAGDGSFTYTPTAGYSGDDSFTYTITDSAGATATATVFFGVAPASNLPPIAPDRTLTTEADVDVTFDPLAGVTDPNGDALWVRAGEQPAHGFVQQYTDGTIAYVPDGTFVGTDGFTYEVHDGTNVVTVRVTVVLSPSTAPVATDDAVTVPAGGTVTIDPLANDTFIGTPTVKVLSTAQYGTVAVDAATGKLTYVAAAGTNALGDSFAYQITDERGRWSVASVDITFTAANRPPVANDDVAATPIGTPVSIDVLANDYDRDGTPLTVSVVSQPEFGGTAVVRKDGTIDFTPAKGYVGMASFSYDVTDESGAVARATVTVTVYDPTPPDAPVKSYTVGKGRTLTVSLGDGVLAGSGYQGWLAGLETGPAHGVLRLAEDGSFTYTPRRASSAPTRSSSPSTTASGATGRSPQPSP